MASTPGRWRPPLLGIAPAMAKGEDRVAPCCQDRAARHRAGGSRRGVPLRNRVLPISRPASWDWRIGGEAAIDCLRRALQAAPAYADAMFTLALLLQRGSRHKEAAEYWRQYLANDGLSEWAARARRSLKFCEMQIHLSAC